MIIRCRDYNLFLTNFGVSEELLEFSHDPSEACELSEEQLKIYNEKYQGVLDYQVLFHVCA